MNQPERLDNRLGSERIHLDVSDLERRVEKLKLERKKLQEVIAHNAGRKKISRDKIEKLQGEPSLYIGQRLFERALNAAAPCGIGTYVRKLSEDEEYFSRFLQSHGVPTARQLSGSRDDIESVILHSFKGQSALIELQAGKRSLYFDALTDFSPISVNGDIQSPPIGISVELLQHLTVDANTISLNVPRPYVTVIWKYRRQELILVRINPEPRDIPILSDEWNARLGQIFQVGYAKTIFPAYVDGALNNIWGKLSNSRTNTLPKE